MAAKGEIAAESADREFVVTRTFHAPRALVFKAWTDPKHMAQWWGPHGFTNPVCEMDVRPGGVWRIVMRGPDGAEHPAKGVYREVVEPERLVMTMNHSDLSEEWHDLVNPNRDKGKGKPALEALTTVTFEELDGKTTLTIRLRFESAAVRDALLKIGMSQGWAQSLERLEAQAAQARNGEKSMSTRENTPAEDAADRGLVLTRVFDAPRELVYKAWTESERLAHWWGPKGFTMRVSKLDLRPGGVFHYCMTSPDGRDMWGKFVYREIVPPERLVFINSFADDKGNVVPNPWNPNWPLEVLSTVTFSEQEGRTTLTLRGVPVNATELERKTFEDGRESMRKGWAGSLNQLAEYLAQA